VTDANAVNRAAAAGVTAEHADAAPAVEDELKGLRSAVRRREAGAAVRAEVLRGRIADLSADVEILQVLDSYQHDPAKAGPATVALADRVSGREPADADAARDQSLLLLYAGRRERALGMARAALSRYPDDIGLRLVIVEVVIPDGEAAVTGAVHDLVRDPALVDALLHELDQGSLSADVSYWLAVGATNVGRAALAFELSNRALAVQPDDLRIQAVRLRCLIILNRPDEALDEASALLDRDPALLPVRLDRVRALARLGRMEDAATALSELEEHELRGAAFSEVVALRIEILAGENRIGDALELGDRMAAEHPGDQLIAMARARVLTADNVNEWDKALTVVIEARRTSEDNAELRYAHAFILEHLGRREEALEVLGPPAATDPLDFRAQLLRADLLAELGRADDAIAVLNEAASRDPGHVTIAEHRVALLFSKGRYVEALDALEQARTAGMETPGLLLLRAQVLMSLQRYDEAVPCFESVLSTSSGVNASALRTVEDGVRQLAFSGRTPAALMLLQQIDGRYELSVVGRALMAELLRLTNKPGDALAQADRVLASIDDLETQATALGTKSMALTWLSRSAEALDAIDEALRRADGYLFGWMARALALYSMERPSESLRLVEDHFPDGAIPEGWGEWVLTVKTSSLGAVGRPDEAIELLTRALDVARTANGGGDGSPVIRTNLGYYYIRLGRFADALDVMEPARHEDAEGWDPWAMNNLAIALMLAGDADEGELRRIFERELELAADPVVPLNQAVAGWAQFWLGRYDEAIALIDAALKARKDPFLQVRIGLSLLMFGMRRTERAETELRQALAEASQLEDKARGAELLAYGQWASDILIRTGHLAEGPPALQDGRTALQQGG
jgi:tetratricopeptide (TPR) repeat protein